MKLVNIVLATYKPNILYFEKLLHSLNNQTYPNIKIIIRDDSDDEAVFFEVSQLINKMITNFDYVLYRNEKNLGSNRTFEKLTENSEGDYIAYCNQDDIWEKEKIQKLVHEIEREKAVLCYSDLAIIDEIDVLKAKSFKHINKRIIHLHGDNLFGYFLRRNSVTGCTMLINAKVAKDAIPFCHDYYVHDHWLALYASMKGSIAYVKEPLLKYRIHANNQIGAGKLKGINGKNDYLNKKLLKERDKYIYLLNNYKYNETQKKQINETKKWTQCRIDFFRKKSLQNVINMLKSFNYDRQLIILEVVINFLPNRIVNALFKILKR